MIVKYFIIILIVSSLWNSLATANNALSKTLNNRSRTNFLYPLLRNLLKTCKLGTKKIIIYDKVYNSKTFTAIAEHQPRISASLFTDMKKWKKIHRYQFNDLQVDAVIIFVRINSTWDDIKNFFTGWLYNRDCMVYILPIELRKCASYRDILELIMRFYFPKAYFICSKMQTIHVYTHDPYGDTKPPYWNKINQSLLWGKNWTFYERSYNKNMSELCRGFNFKRTDPNNQTFVVFGLDINDHNLNHLKNKDNSYSNRIESFLHIRDKNTILKLKKLLKLKFSYCMVKETNDKERIIRQANKISGIDGLLVRMVFNAFSSWNYFHPILYEPVAIISYNRGRLTPLEKIAKFYGKWTLSSLIVIMMITFLVIWFSTKNISLASFDALRFLINVGIITPMNTWRLKLFFSMIFLYFLVIHATFIGHLTEFLTKVEYRPNIESFEQLKDPSIKKIFSFAYFNHGTKDLDFFNQKLEIIYKSIECKEKMRQPNHACIAPMLVLEDILMSLRAFDTLYISKKTFGLTFLGYPYRPGFPLREKFNWAFMFLFDTGVMTRRIRKKRVVASRAIARHIVLNYVNFRPINISDVSFVFILLMIGNCLGFVCFLFEITFKNQCNKLKFKTIKKPNIVSINTNMTKETLDCN